MSRSNARNPAAIAIAIILCIIFFIDPNNAISNSLLDWASEMYRYARLTTSCEIEAASASFYTEHTQFAAR